VLDEFKEEVGGLADNRIPASVAARTGRFSVCDALDAVHEPAADLMTVELARRVVGIIAGEDLSRRVRFVVGR
jgi:hypothetical protein